MNYSLTNDEADSVIRCVPYLLQNHSRIFSSYCTIVLRILRFAAKDSLLRFSNLKFALQKGLSLGATLETLFTANGAEASRGV